MNISFSSKGDFDVARDWLDKVAKSDPAVALNDIAREGEKSLASNTPKDTGATASGWESKITSENGNFEVAWTNNAHPGLNVNLATLIEQGHGTGTGGYVPPRPYIQKSMDSVWKTAGDKIAKELIK